MENDNKEIKAEEKPADAPAPSAPADEPKETTPAPEEKSAEPSKEQAESDQQETPKPDEPAAEEPAEEVKEEVVEELPNRDLKPGMVIRVHERIKDVSPKGQPRERVQVFEGMIIGIKGKKIGRTMTVRKDSKGWMVEKIFPLASPNLSKVEVVKQYRVRRAKLNYLRGKYKKRLKEVKK